MTIKFSILIANYNNGDYLKDAVQSVKEQTHDNWEIIIVDDCSTDGGFDSFSAENTDKRITCYTNTKNMGCGFTKARCVELATGSVCGFLDGDDKLIKTALEDLLLLHRKNPNASLIYSQSYLCNEDLEIVKINDLIGAIPQGASYLDSLFGSPLVNHFATFKREAYLKTKGIRKNLKRAVDQDLYFKLEEQGDLIFLEKPLYLYRYLRTDGKDGISTGPNKRLAKEDYFIVYYEALQRRLKQGIKIPKKTTDGYRRLVIDFYVFKIKNSKNFFDKLKALLDSLKYGGTKDRLNYRIGLLLK
ncbi:MULTISPECIES: glycosyltransferase [Winogradskyella]|uniref:glycosyltransferase n=1 Tax=Winogradskyella TaxID=286104 RepID=UPI0015CE6508|nr:MULTISPECIES: glycosyltransferase [Winogradskyella]QXP80033.1 glycosyltransferase [Winogradskyella sp. HaHa_3_26]